jgi:recombination protein RecR
MLTIFNNPIPQMNKTIEQLTEYFKNFPGIGPRQARRFVYHLLLSPKSYRTELAKKIAELGGSIAQCHLCHRYYDDDRNPNRLCALCGNTGRDATQLMLVEKDADLDAVERGGSYIGHYFVLGGTVSVSTKDAGKHIRLEELKKRIADTGNELKEIIIGTNANPDGEHTTRFILSEIHPLVEKYTITVSTLGRGLSTGTELEYSDKDTIASALKNRIQGL